MSRILVLALFGAVVLLWSVAEATVEGNSDVGDSLQDLGTVSLEGGCGGHVGYWLASADTPRIDDSGHLLDRREIERASQDPSVPRFTCLSARLHLDRIGERPEREIFPYSDWGFGRVWCGPGVTVVLYWEITGGEAPYTVRAVGARSDPRTQEIRIPCTRFRRLHSGDLSSALQKLNVAVRVEDAQGAASGLLMPVTLLAPVPSDSVDDISLVTGWYDASAYPVRTFASDESEWRDSQGVLRYETSGPFIPVAIGRYRTQGSTDWSYFSMSINPPQSDRLYLPPNLSPLQPRTTYEVQGAWIWATNHYQFYIDDEGGSDWPLWFDLWQTWASPAQANWSESHFVRSGGPLCVWAETAGNSIVVRQTSDHGRPECASNDPIVLTWLTSRDWPGVYWAKAFRAPGRTWQIDRPARGGLIDYYIGLPEHTAFVMTWQEPLPWQLRQAPQQSINVRTRARPPFVRAPGVDPSDVKIRVGGDRIIVEWTDQEPYLHGRARLVSAHNDYYDTTVYTPPHDDTRKITVFEGLGRADRFTLSVRFIAGEPLGDGSTLPNMCMVREIRVPPGGADAYLDHYFSGLPEEHGPVVSPAETSGVSVSWFYFYHHADCDLAVYSYP